MVFAESVEKPTTIQGPSQLLEQLEFETITLLESEHEYAQAQALAVNPLTGRAKNYLKEYRYRTRSNTNPPIAGASAAPSSSELASHRGLTSVPEMASVRTRLPVPGESSGDLRDPQSRGMNVYQILRKSRVANQATRSRKTEQEQEDLLHHDDSLTRFDSYRAGHLNAANSAGRTMSRITTLLRLGSTPGVPPSTSYSTAAGLSSLSASRTMRMQTTNRPDHSGGGAVEKGSLRPRAAAAPSITRSTTSDANTAAKTNADSIPATSTTKHARIQSVPLLAPIVVEMDSAPASAADPSTRFDHACAKWPSPVASSQPFASEVEPTCISAAHAHVSEADTPA